MPRGIGAAVTLEMPINRARARPTVRERAASKPLEREEAPRKCCAVRGAIDIIFESCHQSRLRMSYETLLGGCRGEEEAGLLEVGAVGRETGLGALPFPFLAADRRGRTKCSAVVSSRGSHKLCKSSASDRGPIFCLC